MEYLSTPAGRVKLPDALVEGEYSECWTAEWNGDTVSLYFWRQSLQPEGEDDGSFGDVVAHVVMSRKSFDNLPGMLAALAEMRRDAGLE